MALVHVHTDAAHAQKMPASIPDRGIDPVTGSDGVFHAVHGSFHGIGEVKEVEVIIIDLLQGSFIDLDRIGQAAVTVLMRSAN